MASFIGIMDLWPSDAQMAADLDLKYPAVSRWRQRGKIPYKHWPAIVDAAQRRGFQVSAEMLLSATRRQARVRDEPRPVI